MFVPADMTTTFQFFSFSLCRNKSSVIYDRFAHAHKSSRNARKLHAVGALDVQIAFI